MATEIFLNVLHFNQSSGLNFKMEISPFSATIHIKNSLLTDKNGNPLTSSLLDDRHPQCKTENDEQTIKLIHQENVIKSLQTNLENAIDDCEKINERKTDLENVIKTLHTKLDAAELKNLVIDSNDAAKSETISNSDMRKVKKLPRAAFWGERFPQKCDCFQFMTKGHI